MVKMFKAVAISSRSAYILDLKYWINLKMEKTIDKTVGISVHISPIALFFTVSIYFYAFYPAAETIPEIYYKLSLYYLLNYSRALVDSELYDELVDELDDELELARSVGLHLFNFPVRDGGTTNFYYVG